MIEGVRLFSDIELKDFTYEVVEVVYDWKNNLAKIGVEALEQGKTIKHHRYFEFPCSTEWSSDDVITNLKTLETFK